MQSLVGIESINDFGDENYPKTLIDDNSVDTKTIEKIECKDIYFEYSPESSIVKSFSFTFKKGDKVFIEGENGSGKSTILKLISGLYNPTHGEIFINDIKNNKQDFREYICMTGPEDRLINGTLEENLTLGKYIPKETLVNILKELNIYDLFFNDRNGLQTPLSNTDLGLSTGQKNRVLLARALASDADFLLLDEIFQNLDEETKEIISNVINSIDDKIVIFTSHEKNKISFNVNLKLTNKEVKIIV